MYGFVQKLIQFLSYCFKPTGILSTLCWVLGIKASPFIWSEPKARSFLYIICKENRKVFLEVVFHFVREFERVEREVGEWSFFLLMHSSSS